MPWLRKGLLKTERFRSPTNIFATKQTFCAQMAVRCEDTHPPRHICLILPRKSSGANRKTAVRFPFFLSTLTLFPTSTSKKRSTLLSYASLVIYALFNSDTEEKAFSCAETMVQKVGRSPHRSCWSTHALRFLHRRAASIATSSPPALMMMSLMTNRPAALR